MAIRLLENGSNRLLEDGNNRFDEAGGSSPQTIGSVTATVTTSLVTGSIVASGAAVIGANNATVTVSVVTGSITSGAATIGSTTATVTLSVATGSIAASGAAAIGANTATITVTVATGAIGNTTADPHPLIVRIREAPALAIREGRRMTSRITRHRNAERPTTQLEIKDGTGALIDFSTGYTFSFKIGEVGATALLTKTSGISGAATSPNITIAWAAGELDLAPGTYPWQLTATTSSSDRVYDGSITILDVID